MAYMIDTELLPRYEVRVECSKEAPRLNLWSGESINPSLIDFHFIRQSDKGEIAALPMNLGGLATCSGGFRDLAEDFEPGIHQFFPIDIRWPDGTSTSECLYVMNVLRCFDAIDFDNSPDVSIEYSKSGRRYAALRTVVNPRMAVKKQIVTDYHLWRGKQFFGNRNSIFVSNDFYQEIKNRKLCGIQGYRLEET